MCTILSIFSSEKQNIAEQTKLDLIHDFCPIKLHSSTKHTSYWLQTGASKVYIKCITCQIGGSENVYNQLGKNQITVFNDEDFVKGYNVCISISFWYFACALYKPSVESCQNAANGLILHIPPI